MHFVVATASVDDELLDGVRLEERELLHEGIRRRSGGGLASRRRPGGLISREEAQLSDQRIFRGVVVARSHGLDLQ